MAYSTATYHIDPINGSDAQRNTIAISSSVNSNPLKIVTAVVHNLNTNDRVNITGHLLNTNANGTWTITVVDSTSFTLNGRAGNNNGVATGNVYKKPIESTTNASPIKVTAINHGLITGAVVQVVGHLVNTNAVGVWKVTAVDSDNYTLDGSIGNGVGVASGYVIPYGGMNWTDAWKTITSGATAARVAPNDTVKIAKSPSPVLIGNAKWTDGPLPATQIPTSSTNTTPIVINKNNHGYANGDSIRITGHGVNTNANGVWIISNVTTNSFELTGSIGNGVGAATGTMQNINCRTVLLENNPDLKSIEYCDTIWTGVNGSTVSLAGGMKHGYGCMKMLWPITTVNTKYAFKTIPLTDFSAYQKISFWYYSGLAVGANTWKICLCSDTNGDVIVDSFSINFTSNVATTVVEIFKSGGGNLGSSIQSIALYSDTRVTTSTSASYYVQLDNILACTTDGLSLKSLISKNSLEQGGSEAWFNIQSIQDKIIVLDSNSGSGTGVGRGYTGTTEVCATYKRETYAVNVPVATAIAIHTINDSGTENNLITYSGGWNTNTNLQDGETFFDALSAYGYVFYILTKSFLKFEHLSGAGGQAVWYFGTNVTNVDIKYSFCSGAAIALYAVTNVRNLTFSEFNATNCGAAAGGALSFDITCSNIKGFQNVKANNCDGASLVGQGSVEMQSLECKNNGTYGINFNGNVNVKNLDAKNNVSGTITTQKEICLKNAISTDASFVSGFNTYGESKVVSEYHNGNVNDNYIFVDGATINSQIAVRHIASGLAWKTLITGNWKTVNYPIKLSVIKMAVNANTLATIRAWVKKDTASDIGASLFCKGGQLTGVGSDVEVVKANDTNWEQLTLTFTPTEKGVIEIELKTWYISGTIDSTYASYVHDLSMMQE